MKINPPPCVRCEMGPISKADSYCLDCWEFLLSRAWAELVNSLQEVSL